MSVEKVMNVEKGPGIFDRVVAAAELSFVAVPLVIAFGSLGEANAAHADIDRAYAASQADTGSGLTEALETARQSVPKGPVEAIKTAYISSDPSDLQRILDLDKGEATEVSDYHDYHLEASARVSVQAAMDEEGTSNRLAMSLVPAVGLGLSAGRSVRDRIAKNKAKRKQIK